MESFVPSRAFQVLYDFEGTNERELTVSSGEIALAQDSSDKNSSDDWIYVVKLRDSTKRGFVPSGFIAELSSAEASRYISSYTMESISQARSATPPSTPGSPNLNRLTSSSLTFPSTSTRAYPPNLSEQQQQQQQLLPQYHPPQTPPGYTPHPSNNANSANVSLSSINYPSRTSSPTPRSSDDRFTTKRPTTPSRPSPVFSQSAKINPPSVIADSSSLSVMEMFAKHEAYLRQVMKQREEKFKELEKSIMGTGKEIEKYKELNDTLFQKILKLESTLDAEHNKLKQKVLDEERQTISPTFAYQP